MFALPLNSVHISDVAAGAAAEPCVTAGYHLQLRLVRNHLKLRLCICKSILLTRINNKTVSVEADMSQLRQSPGGQFQKSICYGLH